MIEILTIVLRVIGAVWALGTLLILANAAQLVRSVPGRWVLAGSALTCLAGALLALGSLWGVIAAVAVAIQQGLVYWLGPAEVGEAAPRPMQLWVAVSVALAALLVARAGGFA